MRYENALNEQNQQLKNYLEQMRSASSLVVDASKSLGDAMKGVADEEASHAGNLKQAHTSMEELVDVFKNFHPEKSAKKPK